MNARDPRQVSSVHMYEAHHPQYRTFYTPQTAQQSPLPLPLPFPLLPLPPLPPLPHLLPPLPFPFSMPMPYHQTAPSPQQPQPDYGPQVVQTSYPHPSPSCGQNVLVGCQPHVQHVPCSYGQDQQQLPQPQQEIIQPYPVQNQVYSSVSSIHTTDDQNGDKLNIHHQQFNKPRNNAESENDSKNIARNDDNRPAEIDEIKKEIETSQKNQQKDDVKPLIEKKIPSNDFQSEQNDEHKRKFKEMIDEKAKNDAQRNDESSPIETKQTNSGLVIPAPAFRSTSQSGRPVRSEYRNYVW